ncbi:hypothetical protein EV421DRAFT_1737503 [Armillaria borealis]|uniref:Uncharacterized protein n=1 Tax=Armillaria borealis TaxID=47425 RepID=A0AA39JF11_9AGAR|nr:hypothetical protein EV421DRAFT_1737503 [Armillaria borealis]
MTVKVNSILRRFFLQRRPREKNLFVSDQVDLDTMTGLAPGSNLSCELGEEKTDPGYPRCKSLHVPVFYDPTLVRLSPYPATHCPSSTITVPKIWFIYNRLDGTNSEMNPSLCQGDPACHCTLCPYRGSHQSFELGVIRAICEPSIKLSTLRAICNVLQHPERLFKLTRREFRPREQTAKIDGGGRKVICPSADQKSILAVGNFGASGRLDFKDKKLESSRALFARETSTEWVAPARSCERYQRGDRLSLYPDESSITDTVVVETLRNPIGWEIALEYDEKRVDAHLVFLGNIDKPQLGETTQAPRRVAFVAV